MTIFRPFFFSFGRASGAEALPAGTPSALEAAGAIPH